MNQTRVPDRYSAVAIVLHWLIAALVIAMVPMGWWMTRALEQPDSQQAAYQVFQIHKSVGFTILALTVVRLVWRLSHPAPPEPAGAKGWETFAARFVHAAFYGLLLAIPLTGWLYVSTGWSAPHDQPLQVATSWFGLFPVPHLPGLEARRDLAFGALGAHGLMAWGGVALFLLHAGAALKHQFVDRDGVLAHMVPWLKPQAAPARRSASGRASVAAGVVGVLGLAMAGWVANAPAAQAPAAVPSAEPSVRAETTAEIVAGTARAWSIDAAASSIGFSGTHTGRAFAGRFEDWTGHVWFDPEDLPGSKVVADVRTGSARTGDATQEGSLRNPEWFDIARFPQARFEASTFRALGGHRYEAQGTLTIKGRAVPVVLPFSLSIANGRARVEGTLELDRGQLDMGMQSDPAADWVSRTIVVTVAVEADAA